MPYIEDCTRIDRAGSGDPVIHVGWLDGAKPFTKGSTSSEFRNKLAWQCVFNKVRQTRGIYQCTICEPIENDDPT